MNRSVVTALTDAMAERGWSDGEQFQLRAEYTGGYSEYIPARIETLVEEGAAVFVSTSNDATRAAADAAPSVPVVMAPGFDAGVMGLLDPDGDGASLVTGVSLPETALWEAKVEFLRRAIPDLELVAVMGDTYTEDGRARLALAVETLEAQGLDVVSFEVSRSAEIRPTLDEAAEQGAGALLLVEGHTIIDKNRSDIAWQAVTMKLPTIATSRDFAQDGILASVAPSRAELQDLVAEQVIAILEGGSAADMPVIEVGETTLAINARTAKDLGLTLPEDSLGGCRLRRLTRNAGFACVQAPRRLHSRSVAGRGVAPPGLRSGATQAALPVGRWSGRRPSGLAFRRWESPTCGASIGLERCLESEPGAG